MELDFAVKVALIIFGLGGVVALAIVPWACIGTGLYDKSKKYQSSRPGQVSGGSITAPPPFTSRNALK